MCARAVAVGGTVVGEPLDQPWGLRQALIADLEAQRWEITQHLRDVGPETWGAEILDDLPGRDSSDDPASGTPHRHTRRAELGLNRGANAECPVRPAR